MQYYLQENNNDMTALFKLDVMLQLSKALLFLYDIELAHRDIKPENILLTYSPNESEGPAVNIKLCDFGCSHFWQADDLFLRQYGTPTYQSPEQISYGKASKLSDVWSLGVVFFMLLTNKMLIDPEQIGDEYNKMKFYDDQLPRLLQTIEKDSMLGAYVNLVLAMLQPLGELPKRMTPQEVEEELEDKLQQMQRDSLSPT